MHPSDEPKNADFGCGVSLCFCPQVIVMGEGEFALINLACVCFGEGRVG